MRFEQVPTDIVEYLRANDIAFDMEKTEDRDGRKIYILVAHTKDRQASRAFFEQVKARYYKRGGKWLPERKQLDPPKLKMLRFAAREPEVEELMTKLGITFDVTESIAIINGIHPTDIYIFEDQGLMPVVQKFLSTRWHQPEDFYGLWVATATKKTTPAHHKSTDDQRE